MPQLMIDRRPIPERCYNQAAWAWGHVIECDPDYFNPDGRKILRVGVTLCPVGKRPDEPRSIVYRRRRRKVVSQRIMAPAPYVAGAEVIGGPYASIDEAVAAVETWLSTHSEE